jgi:hypothetical protein
MSSRSEVYVSVLDESSPEAQRILAQFDLETMELKTHQAYRRSLRPLKPKAPESMPLKSQPLPPEESPSSTKTQGPSSAPVS